jgi:hypothetical protein
MSVMSKYFSGLEWGDVHEFEKMTVIPLIGKPDEGSVYLTLKEAMDMNLLKIMEVDDSGTVPELKAVNMSELPVLILDGEELVGAKQNRVLNTTVLLKGGSETLIPVSCTEEGRWSFNSREFRDQGSVISHSIRGSKRKSVSDSVRMSERYYSDQSSIWNEIRGSIDREVCRSPTSAHRDVYQSKIQDINGYLDAFKLNENQVGILVFIDGKIKGIDIISSPVAYRSLHEKLLKSYALEAVLDQRKINRGGLNTQKEVNRFIKQINESAESKHKSIGHGWDHRFESASILGSALVCQDEVLHASFFKNEIKENDNGQMAGFRMRMGFRA